MRTVRSFLAAAAVAFISSIFAPAALARTEIPGAAQPQLAVGSDGRVWLVYAQIAQTAVDHSAHARGHDAQHGEQSQGGHKKPAHPPQRRSGDVFVACSKEGGATFAPGVKVASVPNLMVGMRRGPRIAAHGDRITVTVIGSELVAFTSQDGGKTWSEPATINDKPASAREGLHDLAGAPDGRVFVTWLDLRNGKMELWGATSDDGGKTWGTNEQIYKSPDKSICECCHPSALFDEEGNLAVLWRNSIEGSRDMWMAVRAKGAARFGPAQKLGEGTWKLNACPMDGGRILALGRGYFGAVWQRNGEIFLSRSESAEMRLGKGKQPVAVHTGFGPPRVFWQDGADLVRLDHPHDATPVKHAADARFASAVAFPGGKGLVLAYERGAKGATSIAIENL